MDLLFCVYSRFLHLLVISNIFMQAETYKLAHIELSQRTHQQEATK